MGRDTARNFVEAYTVELVTVINGRANTSPALTPKELFLAGRATGAPKYDGDESMTKSSLHSVCFHYSLLKFHPLSNRVKNC